jgi:hypothetical protein
MEIASTNVEICHVFGFASFTDKRIVKRILQFSYRSVVRTPLRNRKAAGSITSSGPIVALRAAAPVKY